MKSGGFNLSFFHSLLATKEFRDLRPIEKAVKLKLEYNLTYANCTALTGVTTSSLEKGIKAVKEGRDPGVRGHPTNLTRAEMKNFIENAKKEIADHKDVGYEEAQRLAQRILIESHKVDIKGGMPKFSRKWIKTHFGEHNLAMAPRMTEQDRALSEETVKKFFENYEYLVNHYKIPPEMIWNANETSLDGVGTVKELVETEDHITLVLTVNAVGDHCRPVILPLSTESQLPVEVTREFHISGTENGFLNKNILETVINNGFTKELDNYRRKYNMENSYALLIVTNHSSRNSLQEEALFHDHGIILLSLPPHSSGLIQPLDLSINGTFKQVFCMLQRRRMLQTPEGTVIKAEVRRYRLMDAREALSAALTLHSILEGWRRTGMYPISSGVPLREMTKYKAEPLPQKRKSQIHFVDEENYSSNGEKDENENPQKRSKTTIEMK